MSAQIIRMPVAHSSSQTKKLSPEGASITILSCRRVRKAVLRGPKPSNVVKRATKVIRFADYVDRPEKYTPDTTGRRGGALLAA